MKKDEDRDGAVRSHWQLIDEKSISMAEVREILIEEVENPVWENLCERIWLKIVDEIEFYEQIFEKDYDGSLIVLQKSLKST